MTPKHLAGLRKAVPLNEATPETARPTVVSPDEARWLQELSERAGSSGGLNWCVHRHPDDYPTKFVARPWFIPHDPAHRAESALITAFLVADTLEDLRAMLPPGLSGHVPPGVTDPTVVEVWCRLPVDILFAVVTENSP